WPNVSPKSVPEIGGGARGVPRVRQPSHPPTGHSASARPEDDSRPAAEPQDGADGAGLGARVPTRQSWEGPRGRSLGSEIWPRQLAGEGAWNRTPGGRTERPGCGSVAPAVTCHAKGVFRNPFKA